MATRSTINKLNKDGTVTSIYCHWDGYPEHHMPLLKAGYTEEKDVDELLALGSLSKLGFKPKLCSAYHRDWGEDLRIQHYNSAKEINKEEYNYLWTDGEWFLI